MRNAVANYGFAFLFQSFRSFSSLLLWGVYYYCDEHILKMASSKLTHNLLAITSQS